MKKLNSIFNHPVALTIAKIAMVLFLIDFIRKIFGISLPLPVMVSRAYDFGMIIGKIANVLVKIVGAMVILNLLFATGKFSSKAYNES